MRALIRLARLFAYPGDDYAACAAACAGELDVEALRRFAADVEGIPTTDLQERFVDTFDLDPHCSPELGWHLFGEQYARGEWLAALRGDLRRAGLDESGELPDHLVNVLRLLASEDGARAGALAVRIAPALAALRRGVDQRGSAYRDLVAAACDLVARTATDAPPVATGDAAPEGNGHV